jgi:hypothetical protein
VSFLILTWTFFLVAFNVAEAKSAQQYSHSQTQSHSNLLILSPPMPGIPRPGHNLRCRALAFGYKKFLRAAREMDATRRIDADQMKNDFGPIRFQRAFFNSTRMALRGLLFSRFSI